MPDHLPVPCEEKAEEEEVGACSGACGGGQGMETVTIRVRMEHEAKYGGACDLSTNITSRWCQNEECCEGNKPAIPINARCFS